MLWSLRQNELADTCEKLQKKSAQLRDNSEFVIVHITELWMRLAVIERELERQNKRSTPGA